MSSMLGNSVVPPGILPPLDHYRLQLYNYAMVERLRNSQQQQAAAVAAQQQYSSGNQNSLTSNTSGPCQPNPYPSAAAAAAAAAAALSPYGPRFALSMSLFHNRVFQPEEPKPQHSYIGLIAMAILSSPETKLVLSDIYQHILDNYPYFRSRGPGWRNSIRHNLSLNDCFIKAGRSANGKGHYWAIHPANLEDFKKGDFRRRKAQRKVRKHMGLAVDDEGTDSPSPPPLAVTPPGFQAVAAAAAAQAGLIGGPFCPQTWAQAAAVAMSNAVAANNQSVLTTNSLYTTQSHTSSLSSRKRQFDVASLLAPDDDNSNNCCSSNNNNNNNNYNTRLGFTRTSYHHHQNQYNQTHSLHTALGISHSLHPVGGGVNDETILFQRSLHSNNFVNHHLPFVKRLALSNSSDIDEDIDVVASDVEDDSRPSERSNIKTTETSTVIGDDDDDILLDDEQRSSSTTPILLTNVNESNDNNNYRQQQQYSEKIDRKKKFVDGGNSYANESPINNITEKSESPKLLKQELKLKIDNSEVLTAEPNQHLQYSTNNNNNNSATGGWQGIIQQWPNNFGVGTVDPRILGRYYGQYMAAAAAQQAVAVQHQVSSRRSFSANNKNNNEADVVAGQIEAADGEQTNHQSQINLLANDC